MATLVNNAPTPIIEHLHQSGTLVHRLFEGTLTSETRCLTCETVGHPLLLACVLPPYHFGARGRSRASYLADFGPCTLADAWQRYLLATNRFSISRLTSSKTRVSLRACASSAPARCYVSGISSSATVVADYRRLRSGTSYQLCLSLDDGP